MEFQINVLIKNQPQNMIGVILLYVSLGIVTYYTFPAIMRLLNSKKYGFWLSLIIHGLVGLIFIEWLIMGNTPWSTEPFFAVIAQLGMFAWWATIATMPYLLQQHASQTFTKKIVLFYGLYAVISTFLAFLYGIAPVILMQPPVYLGFFYFYKKFANTLI